MFTLVKLPDELKISRTICLLFLEATLDLTFLNDVEVVALVILVEHVFTRAH